MNTRPISAEELNSYVAKFHPEANFLQSSYWGKVYELIGDRVFYLGFFDAEELIGTCVAIVKPARRGRYLEIPGGPLIDWQSPTHIANAISSIKQLAITEDCVFVRLRPNILNSLENRQIFEQNGFSLSPMHLHAEHTVILNLEKPEEELLSDMRRQTRYEVRRADKLGIEVTSSSEESAFRDFYAVQLETAKRQGFIPSSEDFILAQHTAFGNQAKIYQAKLGNQTLALGLIILHQPEAVYHEAASSIAGRSLPGAYALQWQVIKDAQKLGFKRYNLFGIAPPNATDHRYSNVTIFKKGFGGEEVNYIPAYDLVINPTKYQVTKLIETIRKKKRNLK